MIELGDTPTFIDTHARLIDRRRFDLLFARGEAGAVLAALAGYANADGGFGWALEPDLRSASSQPVGALHAFEVLEEIAPETTPLAARLCDWLASVSLPDGGLPFALPGAAGPGSAPHWAGADHTRSSLHITSAVCAVAQRVAGHDPAVARHPWLARATDHCLQGIAALEEPGGAYELLFVLQLLDALHDERPGAARELERLGSLVPATGALAVAGGVEGEQLRPLDISPLPDRPLRRLFAGDVVARDLDRLAAERLDDGGWDVGWRTVSPAAAIEWRGYLTLRALALLRANGRLA